MDAILDTTDVSYFTIVTCKGTPHFLHASLSICDQLLKIFCHQAMHQPKNVAMVFLFCGRGSTQCIRVFVMPFWQSKGLAFLQSFMLLMCSQKKEVHSLKFWKLKPCVHHENVSAIEEWKTHTTKDLCWLRCFQPHHYPVFIWQILLYSIKKLFLC